VSEVADADHESARVNSIPPQGDDDRRKAPADGAPPQSVPPVAGKNLGSSLAERLARGRAAASALPASPRPFSSSDAPPGRQPVNVPPPPNNQFDVNSSDAYPPLSGRPDSSSTSNGKRIAPRSPRAALEPERVPTPTRRSRGVRNPLVIAGNAVFTGLILLAVVAGILLMIGKQRFEQPGPLEQDKIVNIPRGNGTRDIADLLQREGVIDQPWTFIGSVIVLKARDGLKSGEYQFTKHASLREVVDTIVEGKVVQHAVTVPEGLTSEQIVARLLENDALAGSIKEIPREGTLLPETYKFTRGTSRELIIQKMEQASRRVLQDVWEHRMTDIPLKSPEQLLTMASIVEKETGRPDERTRVAAVFENRIKNKMRLQSDPTIIYGLTGGKGALGRPILKSEIEQHTPYNTYVIDGLPPGPIANPGRASLEAAANPARTKELYFVADGTGGHVFSDNYEQHQKNVARLRSLEQGQSAGGGAAAAPSPSAAPATDPVVNTPPARRPTPKR
jgi:UPF0755 protein